VPRMIRSTTNPYGIGHNWVMDRYALHEGWWNTKVQMEPKGIDGEIDKPRCAIHGHIDENRILLDANPDYKQTIVAAASNKQMKKAWLQGDWNIVAGGMFDDVWTPRNIMPEFEIPLAWRINRAFDWGSSKPFSVGWYTTSDGSDLRLKNGDLISTVRGDVYRIREWYGSTGRANEGVRMLAVDVAKGIVEREILWGLRTGNQCRVKAGPADSSIFTVENGSSIAGDMGNPVRIDGQIYKGVTWEAADKRPGSRKTGWEVMRNMIDQARPRDGLPREKPGFFVVKGRCPQFMRTVLTLPRDEKDLDDADTDAEDHIADEVRYRITASGGGVRSGRTVGLS